MKSIGWRRLPILVLALMLLLTAGPGTASSAPPPVPFSPWGMVVMNGRPIADGATVSAWIDGVQYGAGTTVNSVYIVDVPADDPATPEKEGGAPGSVVHFRVNGAFTDATGLWASGDSPRIDLSASISLYIPALVANSGGSGQAGAAP